MPWRNITNDPCDGSRVNDATEVMDNFAYRLQNLLPLNASGLETDATYNLGSPLYRWFNAYFSGNITIAGTVDGVDVSAIGGLSHARQHALNSASDHTGDLDYSQLDANVATTGVGDTTHLPRSDHAHTGADGSPIISYAPTHVHSSTAGQGGDEIGVCKHISAINDADSSQTISGWGKFNHTSCSGVYGRSDYGYGVWGYGAVAGVYGEGTSASGIGIRGFNGYASGIGVSGTCNQVGGIGVYGVNSDTDLTSFAGYFLGKIKATQGIMPNNDITAPTADLGTMTGTVNLPIKTLIYYGYFDASGQVNLKWASVNLATQVVRVTILYWHVADSRWRFPPTSETVNASDHIWFDGTDTHFFFDTDSNTTNAKWKIMIEYCSGFSF